jgi:hypothetical protein
MMNTAEFLEWLEKEVDRKVSAQLISHWVTRGCQGIRLKRQRIGGCSYFRPEWYWQWQRKIDAIKAMPQRRRRRRAQAST